ncbi:MAG: hypothetical protein ACI8XO_000132 [Verrucomicrobiales bacterium]|jgi:hypothetical protein
MIMKAKMNRLATAVSVFLGIACVAGFAIPQSADAAPRKKKKSSLVREPGAIYLEDFSKSRIKLSVKGEPPIYKSTARKDALGLLKRGREVELVAMTDKQFRVRGEAQHGTVVGWVLPSELTSLDKEFIANLKKLYERQKKVEELIEKNEIALGMTVDEVAESLGRPDRKSSKLDRGGRVDVYEYVTYDRVPQQRYVTGRDGRLYQETYYIKVETGKIKVSFKDKVVQSIEESEGEPLNNGRIKIVPSPIFIR